MYHDHRSRDLRLHFPTLSYTVYADNQRILCINTTSSQTLSKWLTNLLKSTPKSTSVIVGVTAEHQFTKYTKRGVKDHGYDFISLCVGSHCLLYPLLQQADSYKAKQNPRPLYDFFANPSVIAVGMEIEKVKAKLEKHHGIELKKALDLRTMAVEGMKEVGKKVDLWRYNLDKLAETVLRKHFDVVRPEEKLDWYDEESSCCYYNVYTDEKTMFITIDTYLCYLIGFELHGMIHGHEAGKSQDSSKSKKKKERVSEWKAVYNSLQSKLASDSHLKGYYQALSESYQDLSYHLKSCLLYFGLFPEQYAIKINLWIAEGFVECREHQSQREVGEEYLAELIARSLVKVAYVNTYGRVRKCRVHDLMHDFIVKKCEEFNFCQVKKGNPFYFDKWSRRLSIGTNVDFVDLRTSADRNQCSLLRSFLLYNNEKKMISTFVNSLFSKFKLLVTLDFENIRLGHLPETIYTNIESIPKSIGKLRNLETLDLKWTNVSDLPVEIYSLTKLCYLNVYTKAWEGVKLKRGIANLTALQKLALVDASDNVGELKNLKQSRSLKIKNVVGKDGMWLCNAIESMSNLCSLTISAKNNEILELESLTSPPPHLERLYLEKKVPDWVFILKNLIKLELVGFKFTQDELCLVGRYLPELMLLYVRSFEGDELNIQEGWFEKLQALYIWAPTLKAIRIDAGSLPCLQHFSLPLWHRNPEAAQVPDHVRKLMPRNRQILRNRYAERQKPRDRD
ncbi:disease resistance protein RPM1-like [Arachis duranensis]|uniref:Disease resistance protein RPM1-like n=1 Tax=Arachis duranensis TaxID=130453 RepID=A0A6P5MAZ9_ARADU|nr:disease resistance protein RPM1-like [Arachis duranensis]